MFYITIYILIMMLFVTLAVKSEIKVWNKGISIKTGKPWIHFDNDSWGGRGYKSDGFYCWISYPFIDK